jgi:RND family efflux transporter MFP subunit
MTITNSNTLSAVLMVLGLAGAVPAFGEPVGEVEHSDCIIEPMVVVEVGTSVAGVIDEMLVDRSDRVENGQPLARLESSVEEVTLRRSEERADMVSEIRAREADLKLARQKMRRIGDLYGRNMVSKQQRDEAENELERADQAVKIAREKLRLAKLDMEHARAQLDRRLIRSPIKGVILERLAQAGEYVDERPLLSVAQLDPLRVEVLMPAQAFGSVEPGMVAHVMPELAARSPLDARVVLVDPIIDTASGTFGVRLELPNTDYAIPSGMRCRVSFVDRAEDRDAIAAGAGDTLDESGFLSPSSQASTRNDVRAPEAKTEEPDVSAPLETEESPIEFVQSDTPQPEPSSKELPVLAAPPVVVARSTSASADAQSSDQDHGSGDKAPSNVKAETPEQCWRLGPWSDAEERDAVAEELGKRGLRPVSTQESTEANRGWMVYVPGRGGLDTADQLTGLARAGIEDLYVIRRGKQRGDVSVGLYDRRSNALRRTRHLNDRGFPARLTAHHRQVSRYWLRVSPISEQQLNDINGIADSQISPVACDDTGDQPASGVLVGTRPTGQVLSRLE